MVSGRGEFFWGNKDLLKPESGGGYTTHECTETLTVSSNA